MLEYGWSLIRGVKVSPQQRSFFESGLNRGMSVNSIIKALSGTELAIRREVGFALARELKGAKETANTLNSIRLDRMISESKFSQGSQMMKDNYSFWGQVNVVDQTTGETITVHATFSSNRNLTRGEINQRLIDVASAAIRTYDYKLSGVKLTSAYRKG